jgi:hypothetical protein
MEGGSRSGARELLIVGDIEVEVGRITVDVLALLMRRVYRCAGPNTALEDSVFLAASSL